MRNILSLVSSWKSLEATLGKAACSARESQKLYKVARVEDHINATV